MAAVSKRWWGPRSEFQWEEDALKHIHDLLPDAEPYRGWHTFTFTAQSGHVREVDLLVATPGGLFLIEIKSHPGRVVNSGSTWLFHGERVRSIENPLHLTDRKAKELKTQLQRAADKRYGNLRIPFISAAVFLSAPDLVCGLDETQRLHVYGREDRDTGLPGIWSGLLNRPPRSERDRVDARLAKRGEQRAARGLPADPGLPLRAGRHQGSPRVHPPGRPPRVPGPAGHRPPRHRQGRAVQRRARAGAVDRLPP